MKVFGSGDLHEFSLGETDRDIPIDNEAIDIEYREVEGVDCEQIENGNSFASVRRFDIRTKLIFLFISSSDQLVGTINYLIVALDILMFLCQNSNVCD